MSDFDKFKAGGQGHSPDPEDNAPEKKGNILRKQQKMIAEMFKKADLKKKISGKINAATIKKNYMWILLGILIVVLVLSRTAGYLKEVLFGPREEEMREMVEFLETVPVKVYKVKRMDFKDTLPVMGRIEGFKEIELKFDGKGILESFNFEEGERILAGDIIASIDQRDALLKLRYASLELEKARKMYELGGVDKVAFDQKQLEYESARRDLEKTNIYAPSDGFLGSKEIGAGAFVSSQDKIGTFVDYREIYASFDVIEEDSPKIEVGQSVDVFFDAYPGKNYGGTVDMVAPMIQGRTRTQTMKVELSNEDNKLKPGMFARAIINTYEQKDALIIPSSAFKKKDNSYFVYVVHPQETQETEEGVAPELSGDMGSVEEREIDIAYLTHDMAEVGEGLKEGELIIRELHQDFKDEDKVEITEIQETIF